MQLAKLHNGILSVCRRVHTPTYTILVQDYEPGGAKYGQTPPDGWEVVPDAIEGADFVLPWNQPTDAVSAYAAGDMVLHSGKKWRSLVGANVWVPGVTAWAEVTVGTPAWVQPLGAHDAYPVGFVVQHNAKLWRSLVPANVWQPPTNWREIALTPPGLAVVYPAWVQPTGAGDAYPLGARVRHNSKNWQSTVANNVWAPGVYGWVEI